MDWISIYDIGHEQLSSHNMKQRKNELTVNASVLSTPLVNPFQLASSILDSVRLSPARNGPLPARNGPGKSNGIGTGKGGPAG